jgi:hypothetical protein
MAGEEKGNIDMKIFTKEMSMWEFQQRHLWQKYTKDSLSTSYMLGAIVIWKRTACYITVVNTDIQTLL